MALPIPTLGDFTPAAREGRRARRTTRREPQGRLTLQQRIAQSEYPARRDSVVGHCKTIQADRRDAELMLRWTRASLKMATCNPIS